MNTQPSIDCHDLACSLPMLSFQFGTIFRIYPALTMVATYSTHYHAQPDRLDSNLHWSIFRCMISSFKLFVECMNSYQN